jgi:hypothetical protein
VDEQGQIYFTDTGEDVWKVLQYSGMPSGWNTGIPLQHNC